MKLHYIPRYFFPGSIAILAVVLAGSFAAVAQKEITLDQAIQTALENNDGVRAAAVDIDYYQEIKKTSTDIGKLSAAWMHGQYNSIYQDNNYMISQAMPFPTTMASLSRLGKEHVISAQKNLGVVKNDLVYEVKSTWFQLLYLNSLSVILASQDSLYAGFAKASLSRQKAGESNLLEATTAETQSLEVKNEILQNQSDIRILELRLQSLLKSVEPVTTRELLRKKEFQADTVALPSNPRLEWLQQQVVVGSQARRVEQNKIWPDLSIGYFSQSLIGVQNINGQDQYFGRSKHFQGFQIGLALPLWIKPQIARARSYAFHEESLQRSADYYRTTLVSSYAQALQELHKNVSSLRYFETSALPNSGLILRQAQRAFQGGEIGYIEYLQALKIAIGIREKYVKILNQYDQSAIKIEYILGTF